jgi:phytoene dehydrogenase-like protein
MNDTKHQIVIVGAGMAGLASGAYLTRSGFNVLLIEKNEKCGGLLNSVHREGFTFDVGAKSIENSGIIRPMLNDLGINLDLLNSPVSIGIEHDIINIDSIDSLYDYKRLLEKFYPDSIDDIEKIISFIEKTLKDMAILYGIDNPMFKGFMKDKKYLFKVLIPWLGKFLGAVRRMNRLNEPVEDFLKKMSSNQSLIDITDQHFFKNTPTFFAMGYFYVYLDYFYPKGGTGEVPNSIKQKIIEWGGEIQYSTEIVEIIPSEFKIRDITGKTYSYDYLIWCADLKTLYRILRTDGLEKKVKRRISIQKEKFFSCRGGDSIFGLFLGIDEPPEKFKSISNGHFFYTPSKKGLGEIHRSTLKSIIKNFNETPREEILQWLKEFCQLNTYEISIPVLRDPSLAPEGKTGLIISLLFEYELFRKVQKASWYEEFKTEVENCVLETISNSIYPGIKEKILFRFSSTPISISKIAGSSEGAITGWSFEEQVPVVNNLLKIFKSVVTPIPNILQGGQWAYSPSGIPIAILTGFLSAKKVMKDSKSRVWAIKSEHNLES